MRWHGYAVSKEIGDYEGGEIKGHRIPRKTRLNLDNYICVFGTYVSYVAWLLSYGVKKILTKVYK